MPLAGVHITFGYANTGISVTSGPTLLPYNATSSQLMATGATSTVSAPLGSSKVLLSIDASAAIYYATGPVPDASGSGSYPRRYMDPTFGPRDIFVNPGDFFAWVLA